jgi:hypothetical protein
MFDPGFRRCIIHDWVERCVVSQALDRSAATTPVVRSAIRHGQDRSAVSPRGTDPTRIAAKGKARISTTDLATGPDGTQSSGLRGEREAIIVAVLRNTLLPLTIAETGGMRSLPWINLINNGYITYYQ